MVVNEWKKIESDKQSLGKSSGGLGEMGPSTLSNQHPTKQLQATLDWKWGLPKQAPKQNRTPAVASYPERRVSVPWEFAASNRLHFLSECQKAQKNN